MDSWPTVGFAAKRSDLYLLVLVNVTWMIDGYLCDANERGRLERILDWRNILYGGFGPRIGSQPIENPGDSNPTNFRPSSRMYWRRSAEVESVRAFSARDVAAFRAWSRVLPTGSCRSIETTRAIPIYCLLMLLHSNVLRAVLRPTYRTGIRKKIKKNQSAPRFLSSFSFLSLNYRPSGRSITRLICDFVTFDLLISCFRRNVRSRMLLIY